MDLNIDNVLLTGFNDLDNLIGNLNSSKLILLASRPGIGKTNLTLNIAQHIATKEEMPVLIFNLELSEKEIKRRISLITEFEDKQKLNDKDIIYINDKPNIELAEIKKECIKLKEEKNIGFVIIDYLQLIKDYNKHNLSDIYYTLRELSEQLNLTILINSELPRSTDERFNKRQVPRPRLTDFNYTKQIIDDIDVVMLLHRDDYYNNESKKQNIVELEVVKNRNGKTGKIELNYINEYFRFIDLGI